jgi:hypothetical protein
MWIDATAGESSGKKARLRAAWEACRCGLEAAGEVHAVPGHGALSWAHIHYGVDGHFYLSHWERCARRHPGIDAASFLADLLAYTTEIESESLFDAGLETFAH